MPAKKGAAEPSAETTAPRTKTAGSRQPPRDPPEAPPSTAQAPEPRRFSLDSLTWAEAVDFEDLAGVTVTRARAQYLAGDPTARVKWATYLTILRREAPDVPLKTLVDITRSLPYQSVTTETR